jgi:molybdenum cofactor cytidylyltransferase
MTVGACLLASGLSRRFAKGNKLLADFGGRRLFEYAIEAILAASFSESVVVTPYAAIKEYAAARNIAVLDNPDGERGISETIRRGVEYLHERGCAGYMFFHGDQPFLDAAAIGRLVENFNGKNIVIPHFPGNNCSPVIFPAALYENLRTLSGDRGGRQLFKEQERRLKYVEFANSRIFIDIDTDANLAMYEKMAQS